MTQPDVWVLSVSPLSPADPDILSSLQPKSPPPRQTVALYRLHHIHPPPPPTPSPPPSPSPRCISPSAQKWPDHSHCRRPGLKPYPGQLHPACRGPTRTALASPPSAPKGPTPTATPTTSPPLWPSSPPSLPLLPADDPSDHARAARPASETDWLPNISLVSTLTSPDDGRSSATSSARGALTASASTSSASGGRSPPVSSIIAGSRALSPTSPPRRPAPCRRRQPPMALPAAARQHRSRPTPWMRSLTTPASCGTRATFGSRSARC